jgi:methyl-accepting chemotaxis protein
MSVFTKFTVGGKLRLAFGGIFVALMLAGGAGLYQSAQMNRLAQKIVTDRIPSFQIMGRIATAMERFRATQGAALAARTTEQMAVATNARSASLAVIQAALREYEPLIDPGEEAQTLMPAIQAAWKDYQAQSLLLESAADQSVAAEAFTSQLAPTFVRLRAAVAADIAYNDRMMKVEASTINAAYSQAIWVIAAGIAVAALLTVMAALWLNRQVVFPLRRAIAIVGSGSV